MRSSQIPYEDSHVWRIVGLLVSAALFALCITAAGRFGSAFVQVRSLGVDPAARGSGAPLRSMVRSLIAANWFAFTSFSFAIGGTALLGQATESQYLVRLNPGASASSVSPSVWLFSLIYTALTVGLTPLLLVVASVLGRPKRSRTLLEWAAIGGSLVILVIVTAQAAPMLQR